jgi:hypothetical protein
LVLLVAAAMLLITSMIGLLIKPDIVQSLGIVPPDPMPSGVNVVVTGFGMEQQTAQSSAILTPTVSAIAFLHRSSSFRSSIICVGVTI